MVNVRNEQEDESKESNENEEGKKSENRARNEHEGEENRESVGRTTISARGVRGMKRAETRQKSEKRTGRERRIPR